MQKNEPSVRKLLEEIFFLELDTMSVSWSFWSPEDTFSEGVFSFVVESRLARPVSLTYIDCPHHYWIHFLGWTLFRKKFKGLVLNWWEELLSTELFRGSGTRNRRLYCAFWQAHAWIYSHIRDQWYLSPSWVVVIAVIYGKPFLQGLFLLV